MTSKGRTFRPPSKSSEEEDSLSRSTIGTEPTETPKPFGFYETFQSIFAPQPTVGFFLPIDEPEEERKSPETTGTNDSYNTTPVLTESPECFHEEPPEQPQTPKEEKIDMATSMETDLISTPEGSTKEKNTELKLNPPKIFSGKREDFDGLLQDVVLYLNINKQIYNTNDKKIS